MRDKTVERRAVGGGLAEFLDRHRAAVVILSGRAKGMEYLLQQVSVTLGRGPGVDLAFEDETMSRVHAALEWKAGAWHLRDAGSTNGTLLNETAVQSCKLKHGDRFRLGDHVFAFTIEERTHEPQAYAIDED